MFDNFQVLAALVQMTATDYGARNMIEVFTLHCVWISF